MNGDQPARVLVVDDQPAILALVMEHLRRLGYTVQGETDSRLALGIFNAFNPDVCVLDFNMPFLTGADLLDAFKSQDSTVEVLFLTGESEVALAIDLMKRGSIDVLLKPLDSQQLALAVKRALDHRRLLVENTRYRINLERIVTEKTRALDEALTRLMDVHAGTLDALSQALDYRDQGTSGHSRRVAELTANVARHLGLSGNTLIQIEHGALLHDLGKLKIPDGILWKPNKLTEEEWTTIRQHPQHGYDFLRNIDFLKDAAEVVLAHHERFDGSGYPRGLKGAEIPIGARIFAIVDAVDAMIYKRPYNNAPLSFRAAAEEVRRCTGRHFDPDLVPDALQVLERHIPEGLLG